jgi:hypothetical protein
MGIFSNPKSQFGSILEGLAMEVAYLWSIWSILQPFCLFYSLLVYCAAIWYVMRSYVGYVCCHMYGILCGHLVYCVVLWYFLRSFGIFFRLGVLYLEKSGNPGCYIYMLEKHGQSL